MDLGTCGDIGVFTTSRDSNHREAFRASGVPGKKYQKDTI